MQLGLNTVSNDAADVDKSAKIDLRRRLMMPLESEGGMSWLAVGQ